MNDAPAHATERIVPSGTVELVFNLKRDEISVFEPSCKAALPARLAGAAVSGAYSRAFAIDTWAHAAMVGVHFKPGGAANILGVPAGALANRHIDLECLWGQRTRELRERLCAASNAAARFCILDQALLGLLPRATRVRREVGIALSRLGAPGVQVAELARESQLSQRRFIELFTEQVGMTPKRYARVRRFQHARVVAMSAARPSWAQVAHVCGYYDQAHLCRDWLEFTGFSPEQLLRAAAVGTKDNHVAVPESAGSLLSNTTRSRRVF